MARKPRGTAPKEQESQLLQALRFVKLAQQTGGKASYQKHCQFVRDEWQQQYVVAFDGILAAGHPIHDEMVGCPQTFLLIEALERVRGAYTMTMLDNARLSITSGAYRAVVPCEHLSMLMTPSPDPGNYQVDDRWKQAAVRAGTFCTDGAQTVMGASVITYGNRMVGTNGLVIVDAFHGYDMPPGLIIPMTFVKEVARVDAKLIRFGFSADSLTFYFDNGAWIRTQLYQEQYPDVSRILDPLIMTGCTDIPPEFFNAVAAVAPFSDTRLVIIDNNQIRSHRETNIGAQHQCEGLPYETIMVNAEFMTKLKPFVSKLDASTYPNMVVFLGEDVRAVLTRA